MSENEPEHLPLFQRYVGKRVLIYEGVGLVVYARLLGDISRIVVTFNGRGDTKPNREGQGETFFEKYGVSAIHFISTDNHWWQSVDFEIALKFVRKFTDELSVREIITYGSSMGGYGALAASGTLAACRVIAITPQYTIDPELVPWDTRFLKDARKISFVFDDLERQMAECDIILLFDPYFKVDQKHVEIISAHRIVRRVEVAFAEHDVGPVLVECGMLSQVIMEAVLGQFDKGAFLRRFRSARADNWILLGGASRLLHRHKKMKWALHFANCAYEKMATAGSVDRRLAISDRTIKGFVELLTDTGYFQRALEVLRRWQEKRGSRAGWLLMQKAYVLERADDIASALEAYFDLISVYPADRHALAALCRLIPTPKQMKAFYIKHRDACLKSNSATKALASALRRHGLTALLDEFASDVVANYPQDVKLLSLIGKTPNDT